MKTMKASNYSQALKELKKIDENLVSKIAEDINVADSGHYAVILIKKINDVANERYITRAAVQFFNPRAFARLKKNFTTLSYSKIIILHDPTTGDNTISGRLKGHEKSGIRAQVEKELAEKHRKEKEELIAKREAELAKGNNDLDNTPPPPPPPAQKTIEERWEEEKGNYDLGEFDPAKATKAKLAEFAKENEIDLAIADNKVDPMRELVLSWLLESKKPEEL